MKVVVVEDEVRIAAFLEQGLQAHGFNVLVAHDGRRGLGLALGAGVDLVVLDLMLPELDGSEVLARLREQRPDLPVIVLTAKDAVADRVASLNAGADDYLVKPFSFSELLARIHARLRSRSQPVATVLRHGRIALDLHAHTTEVDGRTVGLSAREFRLLETFLRHPGQALSQAQLLDQVWGYDFDPGSNVAEVYVGYLRRKLGADMIETVRGVGYRFQG
ncbi:MAG: response regulator transcription factor [Acidimicrobiia bacterium]